MINKNLTLLVFLVSILSSCVGTKTLYNGLTKEGSTLEYLYDSQINSSGKTDTISILPPQITDPKFLKSGNLEKVKASAVPLIIYTGWSSEHKYSIGQNVINEDVSSFVKESLINEFNRSTSFYSDSASISELQLEIEIDSLGANGSYHSNGYFLFVFFFYSYSSAEYAGSGIAYSKLNYKLRNGQQIIKEGSTKNEIVTEPPEKYVSKFC